jgi:hypothetical protein
MNRLIHETSPYLLQHAHNPVDWYAWKPEALNQAKAENKLILVSIGYSTCHWCHVMERESFEDKDVADVMNDHFICIKVDREERPDIDAIYMEACQIMTGGGGWPLNCFLTPDGQPFYAGTYFPPMPAHNRPSWMQLLHHLARAWREKPEEVLAQAEKMMGYLKKSDQPPVMNATKEPTSNRVGETYLALSDRFDKREGGFGGAPKFPGAMSISWLLQFHYFSGHQEALDHALLSLDKMCMGGIYDHLGGGFARYATDNAWLVPHFEKMLYDNALLVSVLSDAYKYLQSSSVTVSNKEARLQLYRETIEDSLAWVLREMTHTEGGFYSAQDADSEGVEGKFFVWEKQEIETALRNAGFDSNSIEQFCRFYDVTDEGNWEEKNILHREQTYAAFSLDQNIDPEAFKQTLLAQRNALFAVRHQRIYPGLDDKIMLSWSALMISAFAQASTALGNAQYADQAEKSLRFALTQFFPGYTENTADWPAGGLHTWKNGVAHISAFLEDYAYLIAALLDVWQITFNADYLDAAKILTSYTIENFFDPSDNLFYFTASHQSDIILRKKELYDNATPSSNSTMARNLQRLSVMLDQEVWASKAAAMVEVMSPSVVKFPNGFGRWAEAMSNQDIPVREIAVTGPDSVNLALELQKQYLPNAVIAADNGIASVLPLLAEKESETETLIYICRNFACQRPVESVQEAMTLLH